MNDNDQNSVWTAWKASGLLLVLAGVGTWYLSEGAGAAYTIGALLGTATVLVGLIHGTTIAYRRATSSGPENVAYLPARWFRAVYLLAAATAAVGAFWSNPVQSFATVLMAYWATAVLAWAGWEFLESQGGVGA